MKKPDPMLERIEAFNKANGGDVIVRRTRGGYSLFSESQEGAPVARFRGTGNGDEVEVMWWSHRDKWDHIGDFGGEVMSLDEALEFVAKDSMGIFWM